MRNLSYLTGCTLAIALSISTLAADANLVVPESATIKNASEETELSVLEFSPESTKILLETQSRSIKPVRIGPTDRGIAATTAVLLEQIHYSKKPLDDTMSEGFYEQFIDTLDYLHLHFLQSDLDEFEVYRTQLDNYINKKQGDVSPAHKIFTRLLKRVQQRVKHVSTLLTTEKFEFTGDERYNLDRRKAQFPKDIDEAYELWRTHLRYEILQEKLNKEKPDDIAEKIARRYARLLRTFQDYDGDDVLELYLSALAKIYDPHSDYMGKSAFESFNINMKLSLFGIGALLQSEEGYCKIKSLVANGPAEKSKELQANDRIIAVAQGDGEPVDVVDMKLNKVVDLIRGPKGAEVRLTIIPADASDPSERKVVKIIRDKIKLEEQAAKAQLIELPSESPNGRLRLGVIDLPSFYADFKLSEDESDSEEPRSTTRDVEKLIRKLKKENVDGIILDLRRNGGGSLEESINLTGLFIEEGPIVQVKDFQGRVSVDKDTDPRVVYDGPLIVLTSRFSASASEILAGALQDYGRALIVGDVTTHGKGTVQTLLDLERYMGPSLKKPGHLKVTIRKFYRASGVSTQREGVTPDIILPSVNNHADVGEASLERALPGDTIATAKYENLNRIEPILAELTRLSTERIKDDMNFAYRLEDIEQYKKTLADKSVSLNEAERIQEKDTKDAKFKARREEIKSRPRSTETVYDLTLELADVEGLPDPVENDEADKSPDTPVNHEKDDPDAETALPPIDATLKEAKRILADLIQLRSGHAAVASSAKAEPKARTTEAEGVTGATRK